MLSLYKTQIIHSTVDGLPRLKYSLPSATLFGFSYASVWIDEAQEARTGKAFWNACASIFELSLLKVIMTATPLLESPDVCRMFKGS